MRTAASAAVPRVRSCCSNTSWGRSTTGIRRSPTRSLRDEKSSSSTTPVSDAVVNGIHDGMIPVANSYALGEHLPNAVLLTYRDSGHGSLFQFHESFTRQAGAFLTSDSPFAPY
jgi:pimeloyl-ACP methyl ester carboxylesterase